MNKLLFVAVLLGFLIIFVPLFAQNSQIKQNTGITNTQELKVFYGAIKYDADSIIAKYQYFLTKKPDSALKYAQIHLQMAEQQNNLDMRIAASTQMATVFSIVGSTKPIIKYCRQGLQLNLELRNKLYDIEFYLLLSRAYLLDNMADKSLSYGLQAMTIAKDIKNEKLIAKSAESVGNVYYFLLKDSKKSISYYTINANYYLNNEPEVAAGILSNLGNNYYQNEQYDEALKLYQESFAINQQNQDIHGMGYSADNMGLAYRRKKEFIKAHKYFEQGFSYRLAIKGKSEIINSLNHLALSELHFNHFDRALEYGNENLKLSKELNNYDLIVEALETLVKIREKEINYKEIVLLQEQIINYHDSLSLQRNEIKAKEIAATEEFLQAEQENELLKNENLYQSTKLNFQNTVIWITGVAGILVFIFLLIALWERQKQVAAKQKIQQKNSIIETAQLQLSIQNKELVRLNAVQNQLFSIIGHDLKSPIASLLGILGLINSKNISQAEFLQITEILAKNVENVNLLLDNLLAWSVLQQNGSVTNPQYLNLKSSVEFTIALYQEQAKNKAIQLILTIPQALEVYIDEHHLQFVLRNLVANAIKFTKPNGTISINTQSEFLENQKFVRICITDTGVGMSETQLATLFGTKANFSTEGTAGEKGTGLGLKFCKDFIQANNGTLTVESIVGKGSTFCVRLPMK